MKKTLCYLMTFIMVFNFGLGITRIKSRAASYENFRYDIPIYYQKGGGDCGIVSLAIIEAYYNGYRSADKENHYEDFYNQVQRYNDDHNGNNGPNWIADASSLGYYEPANYTDLDTLYSNLKNGPVLIYRSSPHWSVVVGYEGSKNKLEKSGFIVYEVYNFTGSNKSYRDSTVSTHYKNLSDFLGNTNWIHTYCRGTGIVNGGSGGSQSSYVDFTNIRSSDVSTNDATIYADLPSKPYCTEVGFYISTDSSMANARRIPETANCQVPGLFYNMKKWYGALTESTTYYYKFYAIAGGTEYSTDVYSFTTLPSSPGDYLFSNVYEENVTENNARITGILSSYTTIQDCGFQISTNPDMTGAATHYESEKYSVNGAVAASIGYTMQDWHGALQKGTVYYYRLFLTVNGTTYMSSIRSFKTLGDSTPPTIDGFNITNIDGSGYTVSVKASDENGILKVSFPTWTEYNGQDDIKAEWWDTTAVTAPDANGNYTYRVNISDHNSESGKYITHIYAYDPTGNSSHAELEAYVYPLIGITLSESSMELKKGDSNYLSIGLNPEYTTDNGTLTYVSSNTKVATVDETGKVTAIVPGTATITASISGKTATCKVTVKDDSNEKDDSKGKDDSDGKDDSKGKDDSNGEGNSDSGNSSDTVTMLRLYNPNNGEHFYTASTHEKNKLVRIGWQFEGSGWVGPVEDGNPVYRLYSQSYGDHHYTTDASERDWLTTVGWTYEGIAWYSADPSIGKPLYRLYNPNAYTLGQSGAHHYTTSATERDLLVSIGWIDEGIGWYGL